MITPHWVKTRCQPVGILDAVAALCGVLGHEESIGETFDLGGRDILSYHDMLTAVTAMTGRRKVIAPVPLLTPCLSSHWLRLITDVDVTTARSLVESLSNEVIARDDRVWELVSHQPTGFAEAAASAQRGRTVRRTGAITRAESAP